MIWLSLENFLKKKNGHAGFAGHMLTHADRRILTCVLLIGVFNDSQTCATHDYKEIGTLNVPWQKKKPWWCR
jgi:hypothetical protein